MGKALIKQLQVFADLLLSDAIPPVERDKNAVRYFKRPELRNQSIIGGQPFQDGPTVGSVLSWITGETP